MEKPGIAARRTALWLLSKVTGERRALADLLPEAVDRLAPRERAHAQRLACETLRWMDRADRMLGPHLRKRPRLDVLNALRGTAIWRCRYTRFVDARAQIATRVANLRGLFSIRVERRIQPQKCRLIPVHWEKTQSAIRQPLLL